VCILLAGRVIPRERIPATSPAPRAIAMTPKNPPPVGASNQPVFPPYPLTPEEILRLRRLQQSDDDNTEPAELFSPPSLESPASDPCDIVARWERKRSKGTVRHRPRAKSGNCQISSRSAEGAVAANRRRWQEKEQQQKGEQT
jgi:hypothetical protein